MTKKFTVLERDAALKLIDRTVKRGAALANDIQSLAVTCIGYANVHGDVTIAQEAYSKLEGVSGVRFNSFVKYLETYGQLAYDKELKTMVYHKRDDVLKDPVQLVTALSTTRWYTAIKAEAVESIYDVAAQVKKLIDKIEKSVANDKVTVKGIELLDALRLVVPEVEDGSEW
jgi:LPS sulfotransferase NodH